MDYVVKKFDIGGPVRASEMLCTLIAGAVGIATPTGRILEDLDGELVFGSQIYGDAQPSGPAMLLDDPPSAMALGQISRIFAFDLFLGNVDRHLNNYLVRTQNGMQRVLAMDFSHALLCEWPLAALPMPSTCKTVARGRNLRHRWGFDPLQASDCAGRLLDLPAASIVQLVNQIRHPGYPAAWEMIFATGGERKVVSIEQNR